jgi:hypothetical protein
MTSAQIDLVVTIGVKIVGQPIMYLFNSPLKVAGSQSCYLLRMQTCTRCGSIWIIGLYCAISFVVDDCFVEGPAVISVLVCGFRHHALTCMLYMFIDRSSVFAVPLLTHCMSFSCSTDQD